MNAHPSHAPYRRQRGAATLAVVMVLFFIISLVAAYTNRNIIFEQRTSANQYRSTQALEVAEAGLEWAVSMLNYERIDGSCTRSTLLTDNNFRSRYLVIDDTSGKITAQANSTAGVSDLTPTCVWTGSAWSCTCPTTGAITPTPPTGSAQAPAFRVRFKRVIDDLGAYGGDPKQPSVVWVEVAGCTRLDAQCLTFDGQGSLNEGRVVVASMVALAGRAVALPEAALTARAGVNITPGSLTAYNTGPGTSGLAVQSGGTVAAATLVTRGAPGSPPGSSVIQSDSALNLAPVAATDSANDFSTEDRMFASIFNLRPDTFRNQQAAVELTCPSTGCTAATVNAALAQSPGRPIWLSGKLTVDSDIGTATLPALLVVNGSVEFTAAAKIYGLVYTRTANWVTSGPGTVVGAVVAEGNVTGGGTTTIEYDADVLRRVRFNIGSFVRVPGSWRDFSW